VMVSLVITNLLFVSDILVTGTTFFVELLIVGLYSLNQFVRVAVGSDGVRMRRLLGGSRFIPFSAIKEARATGRELHVSLEDGASFAMHHGSGGGLMGSGDKDDAPLAATIVARIREQLVAHRAREKSGPHAFSRAGRSTAEWLRDLSSAATANPSYREQAIPSEELWRVVEDATAPATARAGAAVALRVALDEEGRVRLRAAADACAAPRLRVALEAVASASDESRVRDALDGLDDGHDEPRARAMRSS
jgi:hypothetical protein